VLKKSKSQQNSPRIVTIGGGTGNFTVLSGLKPLLDNSLTAIVSMVDDGGSTGLLRDQYGVLPAGDIRQCLVALSESPQAVRQLFNHRFPKGLNETSKDLSGQNFGNLCLLAAEQITGDITSAVKLAGSMLAISGQVIPVTGDDRRLVITTVDGQVIEGEHQAELTELPSLRGAEISFDKNPTEVNPKAAQAIRQADVVVIVPGDLYTSIAPALAVQGVQEALQKVPCIIQVANLMNRSRHTANFSVADHAAEVERIAGIKLDYVLYNTEAPTEEALKIYARDGEFPVAVNQTEFAQATYQAIGKPLLSKTALQSHPDDPLANNRSLVRHSSPQVAKAILEICQS